MNQTTYITNCPDCGEPAEVNMKVAYASHPAQFGAQCRYEKCGKTFTVFRKDIRVGAQGHSANKSTVVQQSFGKQALNMRADEVMINKGSYAVIRRLPENIDSILEKNEVFEKIMDLYILGGDEYEDSERHTLDIFKDDVFDILENYLEEK